MQTHRRIHTRALKHIAHVTHIQSVSVCVYVCVCVLTPCEPVTRAFMARVRSHRGALVVYVIIITIDVVAVLVVVVVMWIYRVREYDYFYDAAKSREACEACQTRDSSLLS